MIRKNKNQNFILNFSRSTIVLASILGLHLIFFTGVSSFSSEIKQGFEKGDGGHLYEDGYRDLEAAIKNLNSYFWSTTDEFFKIYAGDPNVCPDRKLKPIKAKRLLKLINSLVKSPKDIGPWRTDENGNSSPPTFVLQNPGKENAYIEAFRGAFQYFVNRNCKYSENTWKYTTLVLLEALHDFEYCNRLAADHAITLIKLSPAHRQCVSVTKTYPHLKCHTGSMGDFQRFGYDWRDGKKLSHVVIPMETRRARGRKRFNFSMDLREQGNYKFEIVDIETEKKYPLTLVFGPSKNLLEAKFFGYNEFGKFELDVDFAIRRTYVAKVEQENGWNIGELARIFAIRPESKDDFYGIVRAKTK